MRNAVRARHGQRRAERAVSACFRERCREKNPRRGASSRELAGTSGAREGGSNPTRGSSGARNYGRGRCREYRMGRPQRAVRPNRGAENPEPLLPRRLTHSEGADDFKAGSHGRVTEPLATEDLATL
jgi:hypothetical protein